MMDSEFPENLTEDVAEQWRRMPHYIAETVEKLISCKLGLPTILQIADDPTEIDLRNKIAAHFVIAGENLCAAFELMKDEFFTKYYVKV